jgi:hypothetical protein
MLDVKQHKNITERAAICRKGSNSIDFKTKYQITAIKPIAKKTQNTCKVHICGQ